MKEGLNCELSMMSFDMVPGNWVLVGDLSDMYTPIIQVDPSNLVDSLIQSIRKERLKVVERMLKEYSMTELPNDSLVFGIKFSRRNKFLFFVGRSIHSSSHGALKGFITDKGKIIDHFLAEAERIKSLIS